MARSKVSAAFVPTSYKVTPGNLATVEIEGLKTGPPSKRLVFNQNGLRIKSAMVVSQQKSKTIEHQIVRINHLPTIEQVRLHSASPMYPGKYQVTMQFAGPHNSKLADFTRTTDLAMREWLPCAFENQEASVEIHEKAPTSS